MLASLVLPIIVSTVALFFASFLSWMVLPFHRKDWVKLPNEDPVLAALRAAGIPGGSYMFPGCNAREEMNTPEFKAKQEAGPVGVITVFSDINMGRNLGLTVLYFLAVSFCLAYLGTIAPIPRGADFMTVFRFVTTAGFMTFLAAIVQHSIWFRCRIVGHVLESVVYAAITGAIFAAMWPAA